ncbi:MAG: hypothetical protein ABI461_19035 [Polyangiaceae bacterium]
MDEKKVCAIAAEQAQRLKNDHKYREAHDQLLICTRSVCPSFVRSDCEPWLTEVEKATPSIVVGAVDESGADVVDVRVLIDGVSHAEKLDGMELPVDPGAHQFHFERTTAGFDPIEQQIEIHDGEKMRKVRVTFHAHVDPAKAAAAAKAAEKPVAPPPPASSPPILGYVAAGVSLVALGAGGYFYLSAKSDIDDLKGSCAPRCKDSQVSPIDTKIIVSDIALGLGVVAAAAAAYFFVAHSHTTSTAARVGRLIVPAPSGSGLSIAF